MRLLQGRGLPSGWCVQGLRGAWRRPDTGSLPLSLFLLAPIGGDTCQRSIANGGGWTGLLSDGSQAQVPKHGSQISGPEPHQCVHGRPLRNAGAVTPVSLSSTCIRVQLRFPREADHCHSSSAKEGVAGGVAHVTSQDPPRIWDDPAMGLPGASFIYPRSGAGWHSSSRGMDGAGSLCQLPPSAVGEDRCDIWSSCSHFGARGAQHPHDQGGAGWETLVP